MKKFSYIIPMLALALASCGDDAHETYNVPTPSGEKATVTEASISNGATVDANSVSAITLKFDRNVAISTKVSPTLNGSSLTASYATDADGNSILNEVTLPVTLAEGTSYTLEVTERCFAAVNSGVYGNAYSLSFSTSAAAPVVSSIASITNENATAQAKALYSQLVNDYGNAMYSGAMGGVAWENGYAEFIQAQTGHMPAVVGYDYIHLASSPCDWINYGDIAPVKTTADNGGLVQISWHWNVPVSEGSSTLSSSLENNDFQAANVLVDGTWENTVAKADVEKLAGYLKQLQDAGIAVLWRPFHEAAGDYTWGAWFWWGNGGTDVTKQLWSWLRDELTNTYGLNNLIWVWTVQTSNGGNLADLSQLQGAYPGDDVVDLVGVDLYPSDQLSDQSAVYNLVNRLVDGKKMIALSECGNLIDAAKAKDSQALWSYFMQWYDMDANGNWTFNNYAGPDQWNATFANSFVK